MKWLLKLIPRRAERKTTRARFEHGVAQDPEDLRDHKVQIFFSPEEKRVMLTKYTSDVRQQGKAQSCTAHTAVLVYEIESRIHQKYDIEGSEQFNYNMSRHMNNLFPYDKGSYMRDAFKTLNQYGNCPEKIMPYNDTNINYGIPLFATSFAKIFRIKEYLRLLTPQSIKQKIKDQHPVGIALPIYAEIYPCLGNIPVPAEGEKSIGAHAMTIIGYDDDKKAFYVQNSWGTGWGSRGYAWLPYEYLDKVEWFDAWSINL
jgi:C1A family cysteine protease